MSLLKQVAILNRKSGAAKSENDAVLVTDERLYGSFPPQPAQRIASVVFDPEARANDHFGANVDIDGDTVIVGAPHFDTVVGGTRRVDSGSAFLYGRHSGGTNNWGLATKAASPNAQAGEFYGASVAIAGDLTLVGAPRENAAASPNGFIDLRRRNAGGPSSWGVIDRFVDGPEVLQDRFGTSVALDLFTGAAGSAVDGSNAGSARVYQFLFDQGPRHAFPIADPSAPENQAFSFQVPATTFGDANFGAALSYSATQSDGTPLPPAGWLSFNAATRTFTGTPVPANNRDYRIIVRAVNQLGSAATLGNNSLENTVWGMLANPDNDSARNLLEMIYNTLPETREPSPLVVVKNADSTVSVTFPRNPAVPLQFIHVEWGDTLTAWQRHSVGYITFTSGGKEYITATIYPDAPRKSIYLRVAGGL